MHCNVSKFRQQLLDLNQQLSERWDEYRNDRRLALRAGRPGPAPHPIPGLSPLPFPGPGPLPMPGPAQIPSWRRRTSSRYLDFLADYLAFGICVLAISDQLRIFQTLHCWKIIDPNIIVFFSDPLFFSRCCWPHQGISVALNPGELRARPVCSWGSLGFSSFDIERRQKKSTFLYYVLSREEKANNELQRTFSR